MAKRLACKACKPNESRGEEESNNYCRDNAKLIKFYIKILYE